MNTHETVCTIALARANAYGLAGLTELYQKLGSATAVVAHRDDVRDVMPEAPARLCSALAAIMQSMPRAEEEAQWCQEHGVEVISLLDDRYPQRLRPCAEAPIALFYKGTASLNPRRTISIVGTRRCTHYGQELIKRFVADLRNLCPDTLVLSGLAYGVDICAHEAALDAGYNTVGVLAHGLDTLYPPRHKPTARRMARQGGLLTEFCTRTNADKVNFVRRNRIVAGMADASILVESASHGGGLITMSLARDYGRDTFAFPGPVGALYSEGCNNLIRNHGAQLITSAADFVDSMGWQSDRQLAEARKRGIERELFPQLSPDEQTIVDLLHSTNDLQVNVLTVRTGLPASALAAALFTLEMKGMVRLYVGGNYHLVE